MIRDAKEDDFALVIRDGPRLVAHVRDVMCS